MVILQLYNKFDEIFDRDRIVISLLLYAYNCETFNSNKPGNISTSDIVGYDLPRPENSANENLVNSH